MNPGLTTCKNCGHQFEGNYCNQCGQSAKVKRFIHVGLLPIFLKGIFKVDNGFFFTIKKLFTRPGEMLRGYLAGKRVRYTNPITYLIVISAVCASLILFSGLIHHINDTFLISANSLNFLAQHLSIRMLLAIPVFVILGRIFYRSYPYNFAEHFIINTYIASQSTLLIGIWMIVLIAFRSLELMYKIVPVCVFISIAIYQVMVFLQFFNAEASRLRWVKAITLVILCLSINITIVRSIFEWLPVSNRYLDIIK